MRGALSIIRNILIFGVLAVFLGIGVVLLNARAPGPLTTPLLHVIPPGQGSVEMGAGLRAAGVIQSEAGFLLSVLLRGHWGDLKAGEYEFTPGQSIFSILDQIAAGRVYVRKLTIPEGWTSAQILKALRAESALTGEVPATIPEGSILPETYLFTRGMARSALLLKMQAAMTETLAILWPLRAPDSPITNMTDWMTLASIVERETGVPNERPRVAAVFLNRLKLGMRLQSDPTVIYAITLGARDLGRPLLTKDLTDTDSPYNTYKYGGLPPGAIAHPGKASLRAVLQPAMSDDLYFVADGTGGHAFAKTLAEHNANVARWRAMAK